MITSNLMPTMNNTHLSRALTLLAGAAVVALVAVLATGEESASQVVAPEPQEQFQLLHAEAFQVDKPFVHKWRADRPQVRSGWLLVIEGGADKLKPIQHLEPVLYVGAQTAERVNAGQSGRLVVIVPGDFRLQDAPIFLGPKALPEALDQFRIDAALSDAVAAGAVAPSVAAIDGAVVAGVKSYATDFELRLRAIDLVEIHSPEERDLIRGWRVPRIK
ncbi:MAG: hypothetical protein ACI89X_004883 [Planctomycetota bacterium]